MNYAQVKSLFERIKRYFNMFTYDDDKVKEWHRFLKEYDPKEVDMKLDEYVQESHDQPPLVYALIRGLNKTEEEPEKIYLMKCEYCGQPMYVGSDMTDFLDHERECMKIDYIDRVSMWTRGVHVVKSKYYEMSKEDLDRAYHQIMDFYEKNKNNDGQVLKEMPTVDNM